MIKRQVLGKCPVCSNNLLVASLHCHQCNTTIHGDFELCKMCRLSQEQQRFVEVFVASRGNIKEVEKVLGMSYPTVRSRLDGVIEALGYPVNRSGDKEEEAVAQDARRQVLEALNRGEIDAAAAIKRLKG